MRHTLTTFQTDPDEGDVQIFVKDNRTQPICCRPKYDTIEKLMLKIQKKTGYKVSQQLLSIRGKPVSYNSRVAKLTLQVFGVMVRVAHFRHLVICIKNAQKRVYRLEQLFFSLLEWSTGTSLVVGLMPSNN